MFFRTVWGSLKRCRHQPELIIGRSIFDGLSEEDLRRLRECPQAVALRKATSRFRPDPNLKSSV